MKKIRNKKNISYIKITKVSFVTMILLFCVIIPTIYSGQITNHLKHSEDLIKEKTSSNNNWWNNSWPYRRIITIDHNKINDNLINYPFLLHISSDTNLSEHAQEDGDDIVFILYSDNTTQLNHEIELFNGSSGELIAWVNIPNLNSSIDTKFWIYYGNVNSENQENTGDIWDSNFVMVQHLNEPTGTLFDSTYNNNDGIANGSTYNSSSKIGGGYNFDGLDDYIDVGKFDVVGGGLTLSLWFNANVLSSTCSGSRLISKATGHSSYMHYWMIGVLNYGNKFRFRLKTNEGGTKEQTVYTGGINTGEWYHFVATYDGSKMKIFKDGVLLGAATKTGNISTSNSTSDWIGANPPDIYDCWNGLIDEVRISNIGRDSNWISLSYKNQNNSESFITISAQELCEYTLTINIEGNGSVTKDPDQETYEYGTIVEITGVPDTGWSFSHWSGDLNSNNNPENITIDSDKTVTANFSINEYNLTINIEGNGSVTKDPDQETYEYGTIVEITGVPDTGWSFSHWSGDLNSNNNPENITIDSDKTVTANFSINEYNLTINIEGNGSVTKDPDQNTYEYGTTVELTAIPDPGWSFDHWSGNLTGSNNPENIFMDYNKTVTTNFIQLFPVLDCDGSLSWTCLPGVIVTGNFTVENIGDPKSLLDWEIIEWPEWGQWTFNPSSGDDLMPEDGPFNVDVIVVTPKILNRSSKGEEYTGEVKIINRENENDCCTIQVYLKTPRSRSLYNIFFFRLFEPLHNLFQLLQRLFQQSIL